MAYTPEELELFDKTRKGLNVCEVCGTKKQMYYGVWCPLCDKPQAQSGSLNAIKCLMHLEALGHTGIENRLWWEWCEVYQFRNDSYEQIGRPDEYDEAQYVADMTLLWDTFGIEGDSHLFEFSW